jgi:ankyrin repeat protein
LTFSARPLTIEEVAEVAAIDVARKPAFDRDEVPEDPLEVLEICSSLVTIRVDGVEALTGLPRRVVTLAHHSIQEYLVSDRIKQGAARRYRMEEIECHIAITKGCLGYLNQFQQPITEELFTLSALAQYSAEFWNDHFQKTGYRWDEVSPLVLSLCSTGNPAYLSWIRLHDPDGIEWGPNFERRLESIAPPLYYAASIGSTIISRLLLDQGADVDAQGGEYGNALQAASAKGHEGVVKQLIDAGADVNAMNEKLGNALQVASARGHKQVVRMLLDSSAGIDAHSGRYSNALQTVTEKGYSSIVRILPEYYDFTTGLMIAHTDSGYASQKQGNSLGPRSIQDPRFQQHLYSRADTSTQILSSCEVEADLDDIRSIESDHEIIGSKILTDRSKAELFAVKYLASFIAQLEDLRSLHEVALEKIDRRRFTKNYRKILKSYYRRLLHEAANDTEKEVTKVLRSRQNRESIAEGIADHLQHVEEEEFRPLAGLVAQPTEKQYLENWLRRTQGVRHDPSNEATQELDPEEYHPESSDDDSGLESDSEADSHDFLNVSRAEKFLKQGSAFRNLVLDIRPLMLPGHLREIIETTPKSSLQLLSKNDTTWVNRTKASLETYTGLEWDWWPLAPRVPDLGVEEHNLQWKVCGLSYCMKHYLRC